MRVLSAAELLEVWERGLTQAPIVRALSFLEAACPEMTFDQIAVLSIGQRDARLLALREALFGPDLEAVANCPGCGQRLELNLSTTELRSDTRPEPHAEEFTLSVANYNLRLRPPNSQDVLSAGSLADPAEGREQLLQRCLLSAECGDVPVELDHLSAEVAEAVAQKMAEADPLADIRLFISCPACRHEWRAVFDIASFLWSEVEGWAGRILNEVHTLASAYGWRERDILALSPMRRQFYLDMVWA
ncbi:MAG: phage baseplate protein [Acidobacteriota bacterium]